MPGKKRNTAATSRRDRDGWLVDRKTGALIGPDPEIERELTDAELARGRVMGRPSLPEHKRRVQITMRWAPETIKALKASGPRWTNFAEQVVRIALTNQIRTKPTGKKIGAKTRNTAVGVGGVARLRGTGRGAKKHGTK